MEKQQTILGVIAIVACTAALFITQGRAVTGNSNFYSLRPQLKLSYYSFQP